MGPLIEQGRLKLPQSGKAPGVLVADEEALNPSEPAPQGQS